MLSWWTAWGRPKRSITFPLCLLVLRNSILHILLDVGGCFYHHGSWLKLFLFMYVSHFHGKAVECGDCVSYSFGDISLPYFSSLLRDSVILCIFLIMLFLVTFFKSFYLFSGRELHRSVALCWFFCSNCLCFVVGELMKKRHGQTLGCCSRLLLFIVGSPGSGERWTVQKGPTYICKKLVIYTPPQLLKT